MSRENLPEVRRCQGGSLVPPPLVTADRTRSSIPEGTGYVRTYTGGGLKPGRHAA